MTLKGVRQKLLAFGLVTVLSACQGTGADNFLGQSGDVGPTIVATPAPTRPLVLAASSTVNFSTLSLGSSSTQTVTFVNAGGDLASLDVLSFTASTGSLTALSTANDTCSNSVLVVGGTCSVDIIFNPASTGSYVGVLSLNYVSPKLTSYSVTLPYSGTATLVPPAVASNPSSWDFGSVSTNTNNIKMLTISNSATGVAQFDAATISGSGYSISTDACNTLSITSSSGTCVITIAFNPTVTGSSLGTLTLHYRNSASAALTTNVSLSGIGVTPQPDVQSNPASWDFGTLATGATSSKTLIISNTSTGAAVFSAASISGSGYSITSDGCNGLSKDSTSGTCNITVQFSPLVPGSSLGQLTLNYTPSGGSATTKAVSLSGIGNVPQPVLTLSPSPFNFGNIATNSFSNQIITVSNNTSVSATIGTATISGSGYTIVANTCNSTVLGAAANCTITVRFTPAGLGAASGTLTVPYSSAQGLNYTATDSLGGTGITPTVAFSFSGFTGVPGTDTTNLTASGVTLQWTAQSAAAYYRITRTGPATVVTANLTPTTVATYNVSGLAPNTSYQFKVNAYDSSDVSDGNNNWVTVTTPNVTGATFNGWSDVVSLGGVYTDIGTFDTFMSWTGSTRVERNLAHVIGFDNTAINTGTNQITYSSIYNIPTGMALTFRTNGTAPSPLVSGTVYYAINTSSTTIKLASSYANALANSPLTLTSVGTGDMTLMPGALVRLGWDAFTFTPSGTASSYNIYRGTSAGGPFTQVGTSVTNSFTDYTVSEQTTYYYKVHPAISGTEITAATVNDSVIQVYVPPQNMALMHRWMANREACTNLLGATWPAGVDRNSNYSCSYTWGTGYAPNTTQSKSIWDLGYSLVIDRYQNGCNLGRWAGSTGTAAPTAGVGTANSVYFTTSTGTGNVMYASPLRCYYKDPSAGWIQEQNISLAQKSYFLALRTNYPGYPPAQTTQTQAYNACQQRSISSITDGNGNAALRLLAHHEVTLARAIQGVNLNNRTAGVLNTIFNSQNLPANGSCAERLNNAGTFLDGVNVLTDPSTWFKANHHTVNGTQLTRNCYTRYEMSDFWAVAMEWTSSQYFQSANGNGYFVASALNPKDNLLENYAMNGSTMGVSLNLASPTSPFGTGTSGSYANNIILPLFGVRSMAASTTLGTRSMNLSTLDFGSVPSMLIYISGNYLQGVTVNNIANGNSASRFSFDFNSTTTSYEEQSVQQGINFRCAGQVGP